MINTFIHLFNKNSWKNEKWLFHVFFSSRFSSSLIHTLLRKTLDIFQDEIKSLLPFVEVCLIFLGKFWHAWIYCPWWSLALNFIMVCINLYSDCVLTCLYPGTRLWTPRKKGPWLKYFLAFPSQHCFWYKANGERPFVSLRSLIVFPPHEHRLGTVSACWG